MRTREEVVHAFTPVGKLGQVAQQKLLKLEIAFKDIATEVLDLVPESADRTAALRKLLESKFTCIQAVSHEKEASKQASPAKPDESSLEKAKDAKNQKHQEKGRP